ncbi:hypothetical protein [Mangrovimonas sp. TPBH4]|uniref:hypothetical protein n=1 Tax=Mangrovimonas sp. TPBH4 TaxID=1645914 RepID=UPI000A6395E3|nr:hypothetical protein [Mangrovimonas sp. TPBH4]
MKALKITLLLLAVLVLTVSGQRSDVSNDNTPTYKEYSNKNLLAHERSIGKLKTNG